MDFSRHSSTVGAVGEGDRLGGRGVRVRIPPLLLPASSHVPALAVRALPLAGGTQRTSGRGSLRTSEQEDTSHTGAWEEAQWEPGN